MNNILYTNEVSLKNFQQLEISIIPHQKTVWLYFNPKPRSCFTLKLLQELDKFQAILRHYKGKLPINGELVEIEFNVITSHHPVFNYGGDLDYFFSCIKNRDREGLKTYARYAIDAVYYNHVGNELGITTISLIHGDALGGGFEAALSSHVLIAERRAELGLPEVLFNLFPGMGAYNLLSQRLSPVMAERLILSGRRYSAEELYKLGVIDILVDNGEGESAVNKFIHANRYRKNTLRSISKVRRIINPIDYQQLLDIGAIWVDAALNLSEKDLRTMNRLARSQARFAAHESDMPASRVTGS
jgi:DSF synthase